MVRVKILKDLERKLRASTDPAAREVVELIDAENSRLENKRETGSEGSSPGYKELVSLFSFYLGSDLVLPPKPSPEWIIRQVLLAKNMGVNKDNVEQIVRGLRRTYPRGPYQLGFILAKCDLHFRAGQAEGADERVFSAPEAEAEDIRGDGSTSNVYTGRLE